MKILYLASIMSNKSFNCAFEKTKLKPGNSGQKYHQLFCQGLSCNIQEKITVVSQPPIDYFAILHGESDQYINYRYTPIIPIPIIKQFISFFFTFFYVLDWVIRNHNEKKVIICSITRIYNCIPAILIGKLLRIKLALIACDIPRLTFTQKTTEKLPNKVKLGIQISEMFSSSFDMFIFLTEAMNSVLNKKNRPYIVVEGFCDTNMSNFENCLENKLDKKVIVYAGGLYIKYGIETLIKAFVELDYPNSELWLYGTGDIKQENYDSISNVKFKGVKLNTEVIKNEIKASLLVNPRFTNEEYTKYSFPSKLIEYMSTGTFTITTKLPGIPNEYFKYCGTFDEESVVGYKNVLNNYLSMDKAILHERGLESKRFVLTEKNNIKQAQRVYNFIDKNI